MRDWVTLHRITARLPASTNATPCVLCPLPPTEKAGGIVVEAACVIELPFLNGRAKIIENVGLFVLVEKEGA